MFTVTYIALALLPLLVASLATLITVCTVALMWAPLPTLADDDEPEAETSELVSWQAVAAALADTVAQSHQDAPSEAVAASLAWPMAASAEPVPDTLRSMPAHRRSHRMTRRHRRRAAQCMAA